MSAPIQLELLDIPVGRPKDVYRIY